MPISKFPRQIADPLPALVMPERERHLGELIRAHTQIYNERRQLQHERAHKPERHRKTPHADDIELHAVPGIPTAPED